MRASHRSSAGRWGSESNVQTRGESVVVVIVQRLDLLRHRASSWGGESDRARDVEHRDIVLRHYTEPDLTGEVVIKAYATVPSKARVMTGTVVRVVIQPIVDPARTYLHKWHQPVAILGAKWRHKLQAAVVEPHGRGITREDTGSTVRRHTLIRSRIPELAEDRNIARQGQRHFAAINRAVRQLDVLAEWADATAVADVVAEIHVAHVGADLKCGQRRGWNAIVGALDPLR